MRRWIAERWLGILTALMMLVAFIVFFWKGV